MLMAIVLSVAFVFYEGVSLQQQRVSGETSSPAFDTVASVLGGVGQIGASAWPAALVTVVIVSLLVFGVAGGGR